ncbi:hypothetical protein KJI95_17495 [Shewanella sp. JM162201]|uniref:Uncharacterized protein n=2 Tax=Shewanella jiangmenensis TaxID=2837387 RepID=A0ABS5V985_9GAMM|nr:hypothetical protein [Shewanella jiangmenensis]
MATMLSAAAVFGSFAATESWQSRVAPLSALMRRRLGGWEEHMDLRETIGSFVDERPEQGDSLTLYRENGRVYLQTWFSDGCHSRDEMAVTQTEHGMRLDDKGGNFFGEFFVMTAAGLEFHNDAGCFYTAPFYREQAEA